MKNSLVVHQIIKCFLHEMKLLSEFQMAGEFLNNGAMFIAFILEIGSLSLILIFIGVYVWNM